MPTVWSLETQADRGIIETVRVLRSYMLQTIGTLRRITSRQPGLTQEARLRIVQGFIVSRFRHHLLYVKLTQPNKDSLTLYFGEPIASWPCRLPTPLKLINNTSVIVSMQFYMKCSISRAILSCWTASTHCLTQHAVIVDQSFIKQTFFSMPTVGILVLQVASAFMLHFPTAL